MTNPVIRRTATVLALLVSAVFAALAFADTGPPTASFEYSPSAPLSSQDITFTSTSSDPDGPLAPEDWDLDNDGQYDDASGTVAQTSFSAAGDLHRRACRSPTTGRQHRHDLGHGHGRQPPAERLLRHLAGGSHDAADGDFQPRRRAIPTARSQVRSGTSTTTASTTTPAAPRRSRMFLLPGNYTVGLRVTDNDGAPAEVTKVDLDRQPVAVAPRSTSRPRARRRARPVTFTSTSSDPDGTIAG